MLMAKIEKRILSTSFNYGLIVATLKNNIGIVRLLLLHSEVLGINPNTSVVFVSPNQDETQDENQEGDFGATPFYHACKGSLALVELYVYLSKEKRILLKAPEDSEYCPFGHACAEGSYEVIEFLLHKRIEYDIASENQLKRGFLKLCGRHEPNLKIVKKFIKYAKHYRIKYDALDGYGRNALHIATDKDEVELTELILKNASNLGIGQVSHLCF